LKPNRLSASSVLRRLDEVGACECHAHVHRRFHNAVSPERGQIPYIIPCWQHQNAGQIPETALWHLDLGWRPASDRLAAGTHACFEVMRADVSKPLDFGLL
jgi:hypothetical protein